MTPEQREELKQAALKATPGPWDFDTAETPYKIAGGEVVGGDALPWGAVYTTAEYETPDGTESLVVASEIGCDNGRFVARANPAAILSLIAQVEALTVPDDYFAPVVLNPTCACAKCNPNAAGRMMILCATCGNKRCPHATDHRLGCTDSNEPGQPGSSYGPTIPAIPGTKEGA